VSIIRQKFIAASHANEKNHHLRTAPTLTRES